MGGITIAGNALDCYFSQLRGLDEFIDVGVVGECVDRESAANTFRTFIKFIEDFVAKASAFGCPVPCTQTRWPV